MSHITKARSAALASVCRLVVAADRHDQQTIEVGELLAALAGVDIEGLANPRPAEVGNVGRPLAVSVHARL